MATQISLFFRPAKNDLIWSDKAAAINFLKLDNLLFQRLSKKK